MVEWKEYHFAPLMIKIFVEIQINLVISRRPSQDCAFKCQEKYSSAVIGWSETNPYDKHTAPRGSKRCLCYEVESPMDCPSWNPIDKCKPGNPNEKPKCWWDIHAVLSNSNMVVSGCNLKTNVLY